ncbi:hypothetical protein MLD38_021234 [Melastoma candidum]|uniref:Uncharacterized protein n=1 Tax=Melastoma candidum TaxID=119954 RepID=A0ACB9QFC1_9MYRT|nr:hypothetical protein MLD38_021234 [Melastoma candidum]
MQSQIIANLTKLVESCIARRSLSTAKSVHARAFRLCLLGDTFLCNRLIESYSTCGDKSYVLSTFSTTWRKNVFTWNAVLSFFVKSGDFENARKVFDEMPERSPISWNNIISCSARSGRERDALDLYRGMVVEGFVPTRFTLASVFSACGSSGDVEMGRKCHSMAVKVGLEGNMYVGNSLLCMYAKCGFVGEAMRVFDDVSDPNEVSFTALIGGLALTDRFYEGFEVFRMMRRRGICIDAVSLSSALGMCSSGRLDTYADDGGKERFLGVVCGQQIHCLTIKLGLDGDLHLNNSLLDMYAKNGDMYSAEAVFESLTCASVVSWNVMIAGYGYSGDSDKAIRCLRNMQSLGFEPDEVTYINTLAACVYSGDIATAHEMFNSMAMPTISSWNALLSAYFQWGKYKEAINLFRKMQFQIVKPDRTTLAIVLSSCAGMRLLDIGKQVHATLQRAYLDEDVYVVSGLISMYSNCGKVELARTIFDKVPELDIVCWNSMMAGLAFNSLDMESIVLFNEMRKSGVFQSEFSYATVIGCCSELVSSLHGRQLHALATKDGYDNDPYVGTSLIKMYCRCGDVQGARRFFDSLPYRNTVAWNEMIHGYAQQGYGEEAVWLYEKMIDSGTKMDEITFVAVLTACSHAGLADVGIHIFDSMQRDHGIKPLLDHYTCIIDCLGRSGRFSELEALLDKIPCKDDGVVWEVVLSSCRVHANVSLAKRAAEELLRIDPCNSTPYVLLANIYSSLGRWDEVRAVREKMDDAGVVKTAGYSWNDVGHGMPSSRHEEHTELAKWRVEA